MRNKAFAVMVAIAMVVSLIAPLGNVVKGAASLSCSFPFYYAPYDGTQNSGTPVAYYLTITGANPNANYYLNAYYYYGTNPSGSYIWNASTSQWVPTTSSSPSSTSGHPVITTDSSGNWSGWVFVKSRIDKDYGTLPNIRFRAYLTSNTTTQITGTYNSVHMMNMRISGFTPPSWVDTDGGWIEGIAYQIDGTTPASNCPVVVKNSSGTIIGIYMTEDNGVNEGYSSTPGYFKVAAPVGTGYTVEVWDPSTNTKIGNATTDVFVKAGQTTSNVTINGTQTSYPPSVFSTTPSDGATNVPLNTTVKAVFTKAMDSSTINVNTIILKDSSGNPVSGSVSFESSTNTVTFSPSSYLNITTTYTFTILGGSNGVKDSLGNPMPSDYSISFTTQSAGPKVLSTNPVDGATGVAVDTTISATFDKDIDTSTLTTSSFTLKDSSNNSVSGTVSYDSSSKTATFTPSSNLSSNTTYTATLSGSIKDTSGNLMGADYSWSFTTVELPITIAEARAKPLGTTVYIRGNVTVVPGTFNRGFAIQDSTGGIYIYPSTQPTGISLGDVVEVKGTLYNYNNLLELSPVSYINRIGPGTCPDPITLALDQVGESYEGFLVKVTGTVKSKSGTTNITIVLTDGTNDRQVYVYSSTGINTSNILVGDSITVTGFLGQYSSNYQIQPRYQSDILLNKPQIVSTNPVNNATGVSMNSTISVTFDRALDPTSIDNSSIIVKDSSGNQIGGSVSYDNNTFTITFTPSGSLPYDIGITVTVSKNIKDTNGYTMGTDYTFQFATVTFQSPSPTTPFTTSQDTSLKIFAVMYNSLEQGINEKGEAVCLMNTGSATVDISNYTITDFEGTIQFPQDTYIAPDTRIWVAREATEFYNEFGFKPNFEYGKDTDSTVPNLTDVNGTFPIFDNNGDECAMFDSSNSIVDIVVWGNSDYANTGWIGSKITPYIFASYISPEGDIAYRKLDETTGKPIPDTNTASDWSWDPNEPIGGCKIMYPGWDTWDLFPTTVKHSGVVTTTFALSPDNAFYALRDAIRSAQSSIKIELYTITSLELMQEILNRMDAGVQVKVLMDGQVYGATGGTYDQVRWFVTQVVNKGGTAYFLRNPSNSPYPHDRYNNVHIKTIIIDDSKVFISADNLTRSSMPCDDLSDGTAGNRGATILTNDPVIVQGVLKIFNHDFNIGYYDVSPYNPLTDAPPSGYTPPAMDNPSGYYPVQPQPLTVTEYEELELIQSPDTSIKATEGIIGLINRAGAGDIVIDENQYEYLYWGPSSSYINPRLQALINAANRGAQVYILLDSVNSASTNTPTKNYLDSLNNPNIHVLLGNPTSGNGSYPIHNKMFLARIGGKGYVNISSINGSENSSRANRELGIIIQSNAGFEYFYKAFAYDWAVSGGTPLSSNPGTLYFVVSSVNNSSFGSITPLGSISIPYGGSQSFTIKANPGYFIYKVLVDGSPINITNSFKMTYTFTNITSNHTISVEFMKLPDTTPPTVTLPTINGINLDSPNTTLKLKDNSLTFTVSATDESGIARMVVKVNGIVVIDKNNLDPTIALPDGLNTVEVIVYDTVGNYTSKSFKVLVDTKPPTVILPDIPQTTSTNSLTLKGTLIDTVSGVRSLIINDIPVPVTLEGNFETTLTLSQGTNTITLTAEDNMGNKVTKTLTITYTQPQQTKRSHIVTLTINSPTITIDYTITKNIDTQGSKPIIQNGRTLIPIRTLIESLGGKVLWDAKEQKVTIELNGHSVILYIGKTYAYVDGNKRTLDVAPQIINGRTYIPLRFVSESLGMVVDYDSQSKTITIYYIP
ncbi:Ig-like domain-containing protein [Caldisericum exile]|nr:Ig-like domain-containing protein [Caldisericum exile]